jgi:hypothetical protein
MARRSASALSETYESLAMGFQEDAMAGLVRLPENSRLAVPFRRILSLDRLIAYWEKERRENAGGTALMAEHVLAGLERAPELRGPIEDFSVLERHATLINALMSAVFPIGLRNHAFSMAAYPVELRPFYVTPRFRRELVGETGLLGEMETGDLPLETLMMIFGSLGILRRVYGVHFPFEKAVHLRTDDSSTGLTRYYQMRTHLDFVEVRVYGTLPELSPEVEHLRTRVTDLELWRRILPPESFAYYGFMVCDALEVTEEVCLSHLKQELVSKDPLTTPERLLKIQSNLRSLLAIPDLYMTIAGIQADEAFLITPCVGRVRKLDLDEQERLELNEFLGCRSCDQACVVSDLDTEHDYSSPFFDKLRGMGYRSIMLAPFGEADEKRGILALASHQCGILDSLAQLRVAPILPLLSVAMGRTTESTRNRVQAIMKEQFTAIHPAIEWRFQAAAMRYLADEVLEDVVFPEVYPLFGASDIRSSSTTRNHAIQTDLLEQLELADRVLQAAYRVQALPYIDQLRYRLKGWVEELTPGLHSGSETRIIEFLKQEIEPIFGRLERFDVSVLSAAEHYRAQLDPQLGFLYRHRRRFEESVSRIRERITDIICERQEEAQKAFPHYFEMYKTDGVDHTMYLGPSTVPDGHFDRLYLRNLRLWQLLVMVEVARETRNLVSELPVPLETAHLILAQDSPLSIRFHIDEKQFNVDGAYNARYEIIKKRLDKAEVEGTGERATQPGKVTVVYSHPREATEYREYFEYLRDAGQVEPELEELSLGPLQGVQGLKALRVTVR